MFFLRHPFLVFFLFSLSEAVLLAKVGSQIGWGWTILAIVATAMIGSAIWRQQGMETWLRVNQRMAQGEVPGMELLEGLMLIIGGMLLITPGFITDALGFSLLLPFSRKSIARWLLDKGVLQQVRRRGGQPGFGTETNSSARTESAQDRFDQHNAESAFEVNDSKVGSERQVIDGEVIAKKETSTK